MTHIRPLTALIAAAAILAGGDAARSQTIETDLELVLAIDASASVDDDEFALQLGGIATAMRDQEVVDAIAEGPLGRIGVAVVVWGDATLPKQRSHWSVVSGRDDAEALATMVERLPRTVSGGTGLGSGIADAMRMMERNGIEGRRRVVDVSGDGVETPVREIVLTLPDARRMANARGVTVNGLAILNDEPELDAYYRAQVVVGSNAFVVAARNFEDFAAAFRRKILKEIQDQPPMSMTVP